MKIELTRAQITNVNSRPEGSGEGMTYGTDLKMELSVPRSVIDAIVPSDKPYTEQYYSGDDAILDPLFPLKWDKRIGGLFATLHFDNKIKEFENCCIKAGQEWTPQAGQYVKVVMTLQVHPASPTESGILDFLGKRWVEIEIQSMQKDFEDMIKAPKATSTKKKSAKRKASKAKKRTESNK